MSQKSRTSKDSVFLAVEEALNLGTTPSGRDAQRSGQQQQPQRGDPQRTARAPADADPGRTRRPMGRDGAGDGFAGTDFPPAQPPQVEPSTEVLEREIANLTGRAGTAHYAPQPHFAAVQTTGSVPQGQFVTPARVSHAQAANARRAHNEAVDAAQGLVAAIRRPTSIIPFAIAGIAGVIWLLVVGLLIYAQSCEECGGVVSALRTDGTSALGSLLLLLVPPAFLLVIAALVRRTLEMGQVSRALAEVATRLTEPATMANESIISVSQAMRSEVSAMDVALERAVGRATELEIMVRNEVGSLERAYEENEQRVRHLVDEMRADRQNVLSHAEQLRNAISGAHEMLEGESEVVSDRISRSVSDAADRIAETFNTQGQQIAISISSANDVMIDSLTERSSKLLERFEKTGSELGAKLGEGNDRLVAKMTVKAYEIQDHVARVTAKGAKTLSERAEEMAEHVRRTTGELVDTATRRTEELHARLSSTASEVSETLLGTGTRVIESIATSGSEVHQVLQSTGANLSGDIAARGRELVTQMSATGNGFMEALKAEGDAAIARMESRGTAFFDSLLARGDAVDRRLDDTAERVSTALSLSSEKAVNGLARFQASGESFAEMMGRRGDEVVARFESQGARLIEAVDARGSQIDGKLDEAARRVTTALERSGAETSASFAQFRTAGEALSDAIGRRGEQAASALEARGVQLLDAADTRSSRIGAKLDETARRLAEDLEKASFEAAQGFAGFRAAGEALSETLLKRGEQAAALLETRGNGFVDAVLARGTAIDLRLDDTASRVMQNIDAAGRSAATGFADLHAAGQALAEQLGRRGGEVSDALALASREVAETMRVHANTVNDGLAENAGRVFDAVVARGLELDRRVAETGGRVAARIEEAEKATQASLTGETQRVIGAVETGAGRASEAIARAASDSAELVERTGARTAETLRNATTDTLKLLERTGGDVAQSFAGFRTAGEALAAELARRSGDVVQQIEESQRQFAQGLTDQHALSATRIAETEGRLGETLGRHVDAVVSLVDAAGARAEGRAAETVAQLDSQVARLAGQLDEAGSRFATQNATASQDLSGQISRLVADVDAANQRIAREMIATSDGYRASLDQVRADMATALEQATAEIASRLESRSERAMSHIVASTERLNDTLAQFARLAGARLGLPLAGPSAGGSARFGGPAGGAADQWLSQHLTERAYAAAAGTALHLGDSSVVERLAPELGRDERLLWAGRPDLGRVFKSELAWLLVAGLVLLVQAIAYGTLAWNGVLPIEGEMARWGLGAVAGLAGFVGLGLIIAERRRARRAKATIYGLTTQRIMVVLDREGRRHVDSLPLAGIGRIEKHLHPDATGTLIVSSHGREAAELIRLVGIEDAPAVESALRQVACAGRPLLGAF